MQLTPPTFRVTSFQPITKSNCTIFKHSTMDHMPSLYYKLASIHALLQQSISEIFVPYHQHILRTLSRINPHIYKQSSACCREIWHTQAILHKVAVKIVHMHCYHQVNFILHSFHPHIKCMHSLDICEKSAHN